MSFSALPAEIAIYVLELVLPDDIVSFALSCRRIHSLAEPFLRYVISYLREQEELYCIMWSLKTALEDFLFRAEGSTDPKTRIRTHKQLQSQYSTLTIDNLQPLDLLLELSSNSWKALYPRHITIVSGDHHSADLFIRDQSGQVITDESGRPSYKYHE